MSNLKKNSIIIGGSAGVGRALAENLVALGHSVIITARDKRDLVAVSSDLATRYQTLCIPTELHLEKDDFDAKQFIDQCKTHLNTIDYVFFCAGSIDQNDDGIQNIHNLQHLMNINFLNIAKITAHIIPDFEKRNSGAIVFFSSIATARPRKRNVLYSTAKLGLESYAKSLQHAYSNRNFRIQIYALGYVDTSLSYGQKLLFPVASAESVAKYVIKNLDHEFCVKYFSRFWFPIVLILKHLPWFLFKKLSF